nr:MAG TPA: hypothetical protein [Caudoviricetes sp.]
MFILILNVFIFYCELFILYKKEKIGCDTFVLIFSLLFYSNFLLSFLDIS